MGMFRAILRRPFRRGVAVSMLLLLSTLILWLVSYYREVYIQYVTTGGCQYAFSIDSGRAMVARMDVPYARGWDFGARGPVWGNWRYAIWNPRESDSDSGPSTGLWLHHDSFGGRSVAFAFIPFSYFALLFSILPAFVGFRSLLRRRKTARAARLGLCAKCGYDLRAQISGAGGSVCPECGTPVGSHR